VKFRLDRFILSSCGGEKPQFLPFLTFFGLWHLVMSPIGINLRTLSTDAQLQAFPYSTASKSFLYSIAFLAKSGAEEGMEEGTKGSPSPRKVPSSTPNFIPIGGATCRPCGAKNLKIGV